MSPFPQSPIVSTSCSTQVIPISRRRHRWRNLFYISGRKFLLETPDIQSRATPWIWDPTRNSGWSCLAFHNQNWFRAGVPQRLLMLPQLQQLRCVKGQVAEKKHSCFRIEIQEITGISALFIPEDFKAACLQVQFQGRDRTDLWWHLLSFYRT